MSTFYIRDARGETAALKTLYDSYTKSLPHFKQGLVASAMPPQLLTTPGLVCFHDNQASAALLWRTTEDGIVICEFYAESPGATKEAVQALMRDFLKATASARSRYFELWTPGRAKVLQVLPGQGFQAIERTLLAITKRTDSPALWNQFRFLSLRNFGVSPAGCGIIAHLLQEAYAATPDGSFYEEYQRTETCGAYVGRVVSSPFCDLRNSWLAWSPSANKLAGVALSYIWPRAGALYLEQLVVHPLFRGKGLGRALLSHVCGALAQDSLDRVLLTITDENLPALNLLESVGAEQVHSEQAFAHKQTANKAESPRDLEEPRKPGRSAVLSTA